MRHLSSPARRALASAALAAALALGLAGCNTTSSDVTGSIGNVRASADDNPRSDAEWRQSMDAWGARYRQDQSNVEAAIKYARALRAIGQRAQAVAVLEQAAIRNPQDMSLLGEYGRALAAAGNLQQALDVLGRAHTPDNPDWRILNAQGAVLDQLGRHADAQKHYTSALRLMPDEPSVLSNLGLSYLLMKDLKNAEITLRRAAAQPGAEPKVRQNLALVVGLRGKFAEAEQFARQGLSADVAAAIVVYLRLVLAERGRGGKRYVPPPYPGG